MSKLKALITTLVIGTSSVAMAQPSFHSTSRSTVVNPPSYDQRFQRDHRFDRDSRWDRRGDDRFDEERRYRSSWVSLAEPMQLMRGRDVIDVNQRGTFTQLRLQTAIGSSYIQRVVVKFRDGGRQVVEVNRSLDPNNRMMQFLLDGNNRRIESIAVIGTSRRNAAIQVFGI